MTQTDDHDDDAVLGEEQPPAARTTLLTISLCVLNVAAVLAFGYILLMDLNARQRGAYQVFRHDLAIPGLPLKEDAEQPAVGHDPFPRLPLDPEALKDAYQKRTGKTPQDKFRPSELEMQPIRPQDLTDDVLKDVFSKYEQNPVATLDQEIARVKGDLAQRIDKATEDAPKLAKDANGKRALLYAYLLPLAHLTDKIDQVDVLDKAIQAADATKLDELVADAAKRKMLVDLLSRLEEFRPHNPEAKDDVLLHAAALEPAKGLTKERYKVKTDDLADRLVKLVEETIAAADEKGVKQNELEKRRRVAFLLFMLSRTKGADGTALYPAGRAEVVCGIRQFTQAADTYALVLNRLEKRLLPAIERDRGQYVYPLDYRVHDPAKFAEKLTLLLEELGTFPKKGDKADPQAVKRRDAFQAAAKDLFTKEKGNLKTDEKETAGEKALKAVQGLLKAQGVVINEDKEDVKLKVKQAMFDLAVLRMVDGYEPGFVGRHHELVNVVRALSGRITQMDNRLKEMTDQATKLEKEYEGRKLHAAAVAKKVFDARAATQKMATDLARLQDERFRAQVELSDADRRNQIMARRIRELELTYPKGKGRRPQR